ncbi:MAG: glycosyltransferase [Bacteroidales bacterium]|nr:glycosyltransferase [Bacteroidales bacterium]
MRILFTTDTIRRGGKERQIFILTQQLLQKTYDVFIISLKTSSQNYQNEYDINAERIIILKSNSKKQVLHDLKEIILSLHPDIIISWDSKTALFSLIISKRFGIRFINASIQHGIRLKKTSHYLRTLICHLSPNVLANSFAGLRANNLVPGKNRVVLYNGIENKFSVYYSVKEKINKRKELFGRELVSENVFVSVGNLVPYKDYFTVLKALKKFKKTNDFHYIIIGEGHLRPEYENYIEASGLTEHVSLIGQIENISEYLGISDYMIHSSRGEGVSNAILEGMYAGLPIIATHVGGIPETVWPGSSLLFDYKNHHQLLNILMNLDSHFSNFDRKNPSYIAHLGKFSVDSMLANFQSIITKVVEPNE